MAEIAEAASADVSTVSRTLARSPESVRTAKGKRIWEIADQLGYRPNLTAASLRTNATRLIAVMVPRLRDEVLALMYEGIEEELQSNGYQCIVLSTGDDERTQAAKLDLALQRGVDGILFGDAMKGSSDFEPVRSANVPYVLFNRSLPGNVSVSCDDFRGGALAAEHLMSVTDGDLGVYGAMDYARNLAQRAGGFISAAEGAGRRAIADFHIGGGIYAEDGMIAAQGMLEKFEPPFGVFIVNDTAAIGALGEFTRAGLVPGKDVFVVGFNDISLAKATPVSLSTIVSPTRELGRVAATELLSALRGGASKSRTLPVELAIRESTSRQT